MSEDDEPHPPTACGHTSTIKDIPASCLAIILAWICVAPNDMCNNNGSPPHPPSAANNFTLLKMW
ncbi:hypothetical protein CVT25_001365 [Psilocybe cyanescens]|uniref:Uncharacterized protein n=1 Tax=Psilocybe cyanescens TaxID=93625 RepID=A0A409W9Q5_PSICY|nr:hypothetical protein CVT25_001365 [Psilocybe cyanescens]